MIVCFWSKFVLCHSFRFDVELNKIKWREKIDFSAKHKQILNLHLKWKSSKTKQPNVTFYNRKQLMKNNTHLTWTHVSCYTKSHIINFTSDNITPRTSPRGGEKKMGILNFDSQLLIQIIMYHRHCLSSNAVFFFRVHSLVCCCCWHFSFPS